MASGYKIQFDIYSNKIIITDLGLNTLGNPINIADELKNIVWSNDADKTALEYEEIKNGNIIFRDTSKTKKQTTWEVKFIDDNNENIFSSIISGDLGYDLDSFFNTCRKHIGKTRLQD
jgi:hypothetical protein